MRVSVLLLSAMLGLGACANQAQAPASNAAVAPAPASAESAIVGTPARGSKFSKIRIGMGKHEIEDIIGPPTDQGSHLTGKSFIPFYFGGDTSRLEAHYKGEGILTYSPRSLGSSFYELIGMTVDRNERGYES